MGLLFWLVALPISGLGQEESDLIEYYKYKGADTVRRSPLTKAQIRLRSIKATERFDLQLNWGFLIAQQMPDSVPVRTSSSGSRVVGLSFNYLVTDRWMIKVQPGCSFFKITFEQSRQKTFPSPADSANKEKLRTEFLDLALGVAYVLQADTAKGKFISVLEAGISGARLLGSSYKLTRIENGQTAKLKLPGIPDINPWRAGAYLRLSYRFVGLWAFYRFTPVFRISQSAEGFMYPSFPRWELGFSVIL